jgi:hypothetical protein
MTVSPNNVKLDFEYFVTKKLDDSSEESEFTNKIKLSFKY